VKRARLHPVSIEKLGGLRANVRSMVLATIESLQTATGEWTREDRALREPLTPLRKLPIGEVRIAYGLTEEHVEILDVGFRLAHREDHFYARLSERIDNGDYDDVLMEIRAFAAGQPP